MANLQLIYRSKMVLSHSCGFPEGNPRPMTGDSAINLPQRPRRGTAAPTREGPAKFSSRPGWFNQKVVILEDVLKENIFT